MSDLERDVLKILHWMAQGLELEDAEGVRRVCL